MHDRIHRAQDTAPLALCLLLAPAAPHWLPPHPIYTHTTTHHHDQAWDALSDFSLEFGVALLLNLALRGAGRARCDGLVRPLLALCEALLQHPAQQVGGVQGCRCMLLLRSWLQPAATLLSPVREAG